MLILFVAYVIVVSLWLMESESFFTMDKKSILNDIIDIEWIKVLTNKSNDKYYYFSCIEHHTESGNSQNIDLETTNPSRSQGSIEKHMNITGYSLNVERIFCLSDVWRTKINFFCYMNIFHLHLWFNLR